MIVIINIKVDFLLKNKNAIRINNKSIAMVIYKGANSIVPLVIYVSLFSPNAFGLPIEQAAHLNVEE